MPRVKKFSRRRKRASNPTSCQRKARFPAKRKQWTDQQIIEADSAGIMSINKASEMYGVPRTTLKDRLSGRVVHGTKPGPKPYLRHSEERELVDHLTKLSDLGMGKTRREVLLAENVDVDKGILRKGRISGGWWRRFLERNPGMSL